MPAGDEKGISSAHQTSITRKSTACRDNFAFRSKSVSRLPGGRGALVCPRMVPTPARRRLFRCVPFRCVPSLGPLPAGPSALAQPAQRARAGRRRGQRRQRLMLAIAPGASGALRMVLGTAGRADHGHSVAGRGVCRGRPVRIPCYPPGRQPDQAAFARRIRRRRSEARSSSFRPPQVPYFSGLRDCVIQAFGAHRAAGAQRLGLALPDVPFRLPFTVRAEKEHDIRAAARGGILPAPVRPGRQGNLPPYLRHDLDLPQQAQCVFRVQPTQVVPPDVWLACTAFAPS